MKKARFYKENKKEYTNGSVYGWIGQQIPFAIGWHRKYYNTEDELYSEELKGFSMHIESVTYNSEKEAIIGGAVLSGVAKIGDQLHVPFDIKKHKVIEIKAIPNSNAIFLKVKPSKKVRLEVGDLIVV